MKMNEQQTCGDLLRRLLTAADYCWSSQETSRAYTVVADMQVLAALPSSTFSLMFALLVRSCCPWLHLRLPHCTSNVDYASRRSGQREIVSSPWSLDGRSLSLVGWGSSRSDPRVGLISSEHGRVCFLAMSSIHAGRLRSGLRVSRNKPKSLAHLITTEYLVLDRAKCMRVGSQAARAVDPS